MTTKYYQKIKKSSEKKRVNDIKNTKKDSEKKHVENIKIFLKKKKKGKKTRGRYQNFSEEQKHKLLDYMRNYYITHNK